MKIIIAAAKITAKTAEIMIIGRVLFVFSSTAPVVITASACGSKSSSFEAVKNVEKEEV